MQRKIVFILAATEQGTMILNRMDYQRRDDGGLYGVGIELLEHGSFAKAEVGLVAGLLALRRQNFGNGVVVVDCGANIGVHTIAWSGAMVGWGEVIAIEPQERIFYALAGNIVLNNRHNARAIHAAVGAINGSMKLPHLDYTQASNFGGLELRPSAIAEYIGQPAEINAANADTVTCIAIDTLGLDRLDLLKLDVEGMELEALVGATECIRRCRPVIIAEHIKTGLEPLMQALEQLGYRTFISEQNIVAMHLDDPGIISLTDTSSMLRDI